VPSERIGLYLLPLAIGNFCRPLFLGSLFDTIGRKAMIAGTFAISGLLLLMTAYLFADGFLTPVTQTVAWFSIFFFASAAASSAYLTASEIFPLETRALAIACFYALGTAIGGSTSPLLFGWLISSGSAWRVSAGYALAAALYWSPPERNFCWGSTRRASRSKASRTRFPASVPVFLLPTAQHGFRRRLDHWRCLRMDGADFGVGLCRQKREGVVVGLPVFDLPNGRPVGPDAGEETGEGRVSSSTNQMSLRSALLNPC
jgi:MFS family permease